jgi:hypothetical protein
LKEGEEPVARVGTTLEITAEVISTEVVTAKVIAAVE